MAVRSATINVMAAAMLKAARVLNRDFGEIEALQARPKGTADFVQTSRRGVEQMLGRELKRARADALLVLPETEATSGPANERWLVDPLNGLLNFSHGLPLFAVSIAFERAGEVIAGAVYDPLRDQLFWAEKGLGAFVNDRRVRVSARRTLAEAVIASDWPAAADAAEARREVEQRAAIAQLAAGAREFGAPALGLAMVAAGRLDGYWSEGGQRCQLGAGEILVREAGGFVGEAGHGVGARNETRFIAANSYIHAALVAALDQLRDGAAVLHNRL